MSSSGSDEDGSQGKKKPKLRSRYGQSESRIFGASLKKLYDDTLDEPLTKEFKDLLDQLK